MMDATGSCTKSPESFDSASTFPPGPRIRSIKSFSPPWIDVPRRMPSTSTDNRWPARISTRYTSTSASSPDWISPSTVEFNGTICAFLGVSFSPCLDSDSLIEGNGLTQNVTGSLNAVAVRNRNTCSPGGHPRAIARRAFTSVSGLAPGRMSVARMQWL